jgi:xanthine/CO dehydrogenase XdhC/CoxF family maturation factor
MTRRELLDRIIRAYDEGGSATLVTVIGDDSFDKQLIGPGEEPCTSGFWEDEAKRVADEAEAKRRETGLSEMRSPAGAKLSVVVETIRPKTALIVFGAGHVGQAVALIGALAGYQVTVVDDRVEFLNRARFPSNNIKLLAAAFESAATQMDIAANCAVVIVTRGHQFDEVCLRNVIGSPAGYIGMIGSRRRVIAVFQRLERDGISRESLDRVHAPIGLSIGARSPQEIGVAIFAEIIQHFSSHAERRPDPAVEAVAG